jgi:hypothetical protein
MGIKPAPAALKCCLRKLFRQHALDHHSDAPLMAALENNAYVDDIAVTGDVDEETCASMSLARDVAARGKFIFENYVSYPPHLTQQFGVAPTETSFKVLGVRFHPDTDHLSISMKKIGKFWDQDRITKCRPRVFKLVHTTL